MATVSFELSTDHVDRLVDALCGLHGYEQGTEETRVQFSMRILREWLKTQVRRWEQLEAQKVVTDNLTEIDVT